MRKTELSKLLQITTDIVFIMCAVWILIIVFFFQKLPIPEWVRIEFLLPNSVLLMIGSLLAVAIYRLVNSKRVPVPIFTLMLYMLFCVGAYYYYFVTGWDAGAVIGKAWDAAKNGIVEIPEMYYSQNPNNILQHCYEYAIFKLCINAGMTTFEQATYVLVMINGAVTSLTAILVYEVLSLLYPSNTALANLGYFFYLGLMFISPLVVIIYTDSIALIIPILLIWLYLRAKCRRRDIIGEIVFCLIICFIGFFAFRIKATSTVAFIAVTIAEIISLIDAFSEDRKKTVFNAVVYILILVLMYFITKVLYTSAYEASGVVIDEEMATPFTHYLKMGFNDEVAGTFNFPDSDETAFIDNYQDRYEYNLSEAKHRIKALLPLGIFRFEARKTLVIYHDGSFSIGIDGDYYSTAFPDRDRVISPFLKSLYWIDGRFYPYLKTSFQCIWLTVLLFGAFFGATTNKNGEVVVKITLIGVFLFLALFECQSRYIYIYVPVYITAFAGGFGNVVDKWRKHFG